MRLSRLITSPVRPGAPDFAGGGEFDHGAIVFTTPEI
jgi:hypothetical protein